MHVLNGDVGKNTKSNLFTCNVKLHVTDKTKKQMTETNFRNYLLEVTSSKYGVDKTKRAKDDKEMQASFRKLNVD